MSGPVSADRAGTDRLRGCHICRRRSLRRARGVRPCRRATGPRRASSTYVGLTKPRIIELLLVTTVPAMFLAAGGVPPLLLVLNTMIGGCLAAASANVFNCVLDRDIDERMRRTRRRPLPRHLVGPRAAMVFGIVLGVAGHALAGIPRQLAVGGPGAGRERLLRLRLHDVAEAAELRRTSSGVGSRAASRR